MPAAQAPKNRQASREALYKLRRRGDIGRRSLHKMKSRDGQSVKATGQKKLELALSYTGYNPPPRRKKGRE